MDAIFLWPGGAGLALMLACALGGARHHGTDGHPTAGHPSPVHPAPVHTAPAAQHPLTHHPPAHPAPTAKAAARVKPTGLGLFGQGRVPLPLLWGSALLGWGLFGFWTARLLPPGIALLPSLIIAILGGLASARVTAYLWTRLLPEEETYVTETVELCGLPGTVVYPVDTARGRVHVYDAYGTLHDVSARIVAGQLAIPRGRTVLVTDFDTTHGVLIVEELA